MHARTNLDRQMLKMTIDGSTSAFIRDHFHKKFLFLSVRELIDLFLQALALCEKAGDYTPFADCYHEIRNVHFSYESNDGHAEVDFLLGDNCSIDHRGSSCTVNIPLDSFIQNAEELLKHNKDLPIGVLTSKDQDRLLEYHQKALVALA